MTIYDCKIIGDGKTLATAFRPSIADAKDANGKRIAVTYRCNMEVGADGKPTSARCIAETLEESGTIPVSPDIFPIAALPTEAIGK